jgi:DNA-binding MarR family transcriptional regulator
VYLFPKAPTFGYEFQKGKLWQHENYKAPFDFAIEKTAEELALEKQQVKKTAKLFFSYQPEIYENSKKQFEEELTELFKNYEDKNQPQLRKKAFKIFENLYEKGIVTPNDLKDHENAKISVIKGKRVEQLSLKNIINTKELLPFLNKEIGKEPFLEIEYKIIDVLLNNAKPNIVFDNMFSEKNLQQRLNDISPAKGLVSKDEVVIYTGDVVENYVLGASDYNGNNSTIPLTLTISIPDLEITDVTAISSGSSTITATISHDVDEGYISFENNRNDIRRVFTGVENNDDISYFPLSPTQTVLTG